MSVCNTNENLKKSISSLYYKSFTKPNKEGVVYGIFFFSQYKTENPV